MYLDFHSHQDQYNKKLSDFSTLLSSGLVDSLGIFNYSLGKDEPPFSASYCSVGIHPWYINPLSFERQIANLEEYIKGGEVLLMGECGLDKSISSDLSLQKDVFVAQLYLAQKYSLPVVIHCVKAFEEVQLLTRPFLGKIPLVFHGFRKSPELAKALLDQGYLLSFGFQVLNPNASRLLQFIMDQPINYFLETDDSTRPIGELYLELANCLKISVDTLKDRIFANWKNIEII